MSETIRNVNARLAQEYTIAQSRHDAMVDGLQQEMAARDAERAAILADDYPESLATKAHVQLEQDLAEMEAYGGAGLPLPTKRQTKKRAM